MWGTGTHCFGENRELRKFSKSLGVEYWNFAQCTDSADGRSAVEMALAGLDFGIGLVRDRSVRLRASRSESELTASNLEASALIWAIEALCTSTGFGVPVPYLRGGQQRV